MNNQAAFSKMVKHLRKQGKPSFSHTYGQFGMFAHSAYHGDDNCKCPVGALIPESLYTEDMERINIEELFPHFPQLKILFEGVDVELLIAMQELHDGNPIEIWESEFKKIAYQFNLALPLGD